MVLQQTCTFECYWPQYCSTQRYFIFHNACLSVCLEGVRESLPSLQPLLHSVLGGVDAATALEEHLRNVKVPHYASTQNTEDAYIHSLCQRPVKRQLLKALSAQSHLSRWRHGGSRLVGMPASLSLMHSDCGKVRAQVLALEMLTNTASFLVGEEQGDGEQCDWDSMEGMSDEILQSSTALTNASQLTVPSALLELAPFTEMILPKLKTPSAQVLSLVKSRPEVFSMCNAVWGLAGKAASLLGNLAVGMDSTGSPYFMCWGKLRSMIVAEAPESFIAQVVAAMAAVLRQAHAHNVARELGTLFCSTASG